MARPKPEECDCGNPPTVTFAGEWMCDRCRRLQRQSRELKGGYADNGKTKEYKCYIRRERSTYNFQEFLDTTPIIFPESIARLERMLAEVRG